MRKSPSLALISPATLRAEASTNGKDTVMFSAVTRMSQACTGKRVEVRAPWVNYNVWIEGGEPACTIAAISGGVRFRFVSM